MSSKTNTTAASAHARIDVMEPKVDRILALLESKAGKAQPKKATATKTRKGKARKTAERKAASTTIEGKTCLVSGNRVRFIADHDWAQDGMSVRQLAEAVLVGGQPLTGNWAIGPNRTRMVTGQAPKASKKGKKGSKGTTVAVVAKVSASDPAKPCRRANGTIAPKSEWAMRRSLEARGLDRTQVDAAVSVLG